MSIGMCTCVLFYINDIALESFLSSTCTQKIVHNAKCTSYYVSNCWRVSHRILCNLSTSLRWTTLFQLLITINSAAFIFSFRHRLLDHRECFFCFIKQWQITIWNGYFGWYHYQKGMWVSISLHVLQHLIV